MTASIYLTACTSLMTNLPALITAVEVKFGPPRANEERKGLFVGADETDSQAPGQQRWPGLAHAYRDDSVEIPMLLYVQSGDDDLLTTVTTADGYFQSIETWLRANVDLLVPGGQNVRAQITTYQWWPYYTAEGHTVRLLFTINVEARL